GTRISGKVWAEARQRGRREASVAYTNRAFEQAQAATSLADRDRDRIEAAIRSAALGLAFTSRSTKAPAIRDPNMVLTQFRLAQAQIDAATATWGRHAFWSHGRVDYRKRGVKLAMELFGAPEKDLPQWLRYRTPQYLQVKECLDWALGQRAHLEEL